MAEFDWIERYFAPLANAPGAAALKDDVACLDEIGQIVTVDALVEGVHFLSSDPIDSVARKLVRVNVSDILAKGAVPTEALLTLGWPVERCEGDLAQFAAAFGEELGTWCSKGLIGGDTVHSPGGLFVSLTLFGSVVGERQVVRRSGGQAGDRLWVTGVIGAGAAGLKAARIQEAGSALSAYRVPDIPPLDVAHMISECASASMDVSDGLLADFMKLAAASECAGKLNLDKVPLFKPGTTAQNAMWQVTGGDDYQILFTAPAKMDLHESVSGLRITEIGCLRAGKGVSLCWEGKDLPMPEHTGYQHT